MKVAAFVTSDTVAEAVFQYGLQLHPLDGIQALHRLKQLLCLSVSFGFWVKFVRCSCGLSLYKPQTGPP